ncbi:MAG: glycosyltransferase [Chloroflexi bacterium]|nr:glycosyltransferase [Chloroflexota bacterium]
MTKQLADGLVTLRHHNLIFAASDLGQSYHSSKGRLAVHRAKSFSNPARVGQRVFLWPYTSLIQNLSHCNPHIIHVHDPVIPSILGIKAKKELNIPALITAHQVPSFISTHFPEAYSFGDYRAPTEWH